MNHTDYRTLIDRGRKSGLTTRELYQALGSRRPDDSDNLMGQTDSNGYAPTYNQTGQRVFKPANESPRS